LDTKPRGLCIATRCTTIEEFVARFHPHCDERSIFVSTTAAQQAGVKSPFAIVLADKTPVLRGWCAVLDAWSDANNPYGRPGMRLGVQQLTEASARVFETLLAARRAASAPEPAAYPVFDSAVRIADGSVPIPKPALEEAWCAPTREVDSARLVELVRQTLPPIVTQPEPPAAPAPATPVGPDRRLAAVIVALAIAAALAVIVAFAV
jgi:hypothetical protein